MVSFYMNSKWREEYFTPFLKLVQTDEGINLPELKRRKKARGKVVLEIESPAIRALIEKYVNLKKRRMQVEDTNKNENSE